MDWLRQWLTENEALLWWSGAASIVIFIIGLLAVPMIVANLPADYLKDDYGERREEWRQRHPVLHVLVLLLRNIFGVVIVTAGILMLALPGQGVLTIVIGLLLMTFPGRRRVVSWALSREKVWRAANWLRRKYNRPPLERPSETSAEQSPR